MKAAKLKNHDTEYELLQLDNHYEHKIHFIAMSVLNFSGRSNYKTYSILQYNRDRKYAALDSRPMKIRDKYGVDIIRYGSEIPA